MTAPHVHEVVLDDVRIRCAAQASTMPLDFGQPSRCSCGHTLGRHDIYRACVDCDCAAFCEAEP